MARSRLALGGAVLLGTFLVVGRAGSQGQPGHGQEAPPHGPVLQPRRPGPPNLAAPHGPTPGGAAHGAAEGAHPERGGHAEHAEHGGHAEHDEKAPPPPINWFHGLLGEKADVPPSLLWREPGEPAPFLASIINFGVLAFIVVKFGKKPLRDALVKRKETIVRELEDARRLREAAEKRLAEYEAKLEKIQDDLERIRAEFREQGEREKQRIVQEAKERRERMKRDAEVLLSQEVKQMRQELVVEVVREATQLATQLLSKEMTLGDHDRFAESFLVEIRTGTKRLGAGAVAPSAAAKGSAS